MSSKDRFLEAATELFAKFGFSGVSVREIAKALGMRESAMYKHFSSKADVLEAIILRAKEKLLDFKNNMEVENMSIKKIVGDLQVKLFEFYVQDEFMNKFRKIMIISQYESVEAKARYQDMFVEKSLTYYENIFTLVANDKGIKEINAKLMAYELYSVIFLLMQQYDCDIDKEKACKAKEFLRLHIDTFFEKYSFLGE